MTHTYWMLHPRDFQNEYTVGIATTKEDADQYEVEGYKRIERDYAINRMSRRPASHEQWYASVLIDGKQVYDRYEAARAIRTGRGIDSIEICYGY